ncbi:(2Fe-2S)-binding protein [Candidatus Bathyarchaeota archaeon]|jgi:carbon-monoxide dehydrogenase small subunit|nr:MAG: (2Fe-2S)-binding protein [Candidatus Bathyarchaeota archaeon]
MKVAFELNGKDVTVETRPNQTLVDLLRDELGVTSVKKGCEQGECGACTLMVDGVAVTSCIVLAPQVEGRKVTTLDGLEDDPLMEKLRAAYVENGAVQCGFCTPGMLISSYALLKVNPKPTQEEVKIGIEGNICRCTGYTKIIAAIHDAAERMSDE